MIRRLAASTLVLALAACNATTNPSPPRSSVKADDTVTIKGKVLGADGKPLKAGEIKLATVTGDADKWFTDQSAAGEAGKLDANGAYSFSRKGAETLNALPDPTRKGTQPGALHHTILVVTPDGAVLRRSFFPTKLSNDLGTIQVWDRVEAAVDAADGDVKLTVEPPPGGKGRNVKIYKGDDLWWSSEWAAGAKTMPAYHFDAGAAYKAQAEYTVGDFYHKSAFHAFTASDKGASRVLPIVAAKTDDGRDVTAYTDGKVAAHPVGDLVGITMAIKTDALVLDLGASKAVDRVVLHSPTNVESVVIGDAPSGAGGKSFKPAEIPYESVDVDATGRYVRLVFRATSAMMPHAEVRVIGPKAP